MGTNLTYNGVILRNVLTREFTQEPIRDSSNTDAVYHRFRITVETILNPDLMSTSSPRLGAILPVAGAVSAASAIKAIHRLLSQDRGLLSYDFGGAVVLAASPCGSGRPDADVNNGPRVFQVALNQISPKTVHLIFGVEVAVVVCPTETIHPVLSNRWASSDDIDENFKTTRRWRGKLRLRTAARSAHDYRGIVVPPLAKGWRRKSQHFTAEANALELSYNITDEELTGQAVPSPATSMACRHTESVTVNGALVHGNISIRLDGPRGADKKEMLQRALDICLAKLDWKSETTTNKIDHIEFVDHIGPHVNAIELNARILKAHTATDLGAMKLTDFGKPYEWDKDYDLDTSTVLGPNGTASTVGLFACYLQTQCEGDHSFSRGATKPDKSPGQATEDEPTQSTYTEGPADDQIKPLQYSAFHTTAIYTFLRIESHILRTENRVQLPIAKALPATGDTAAVIRLAPATAKRLVKISAERLGADVQLYKPIDFEVGGFHHKLLNATFNLRPPQKGNDNKDIHAADAEYLYSLNRAPLEDEAMPVGALFWDTSVAAENSFQEYLAPTGDKGLG